MINKMQKTKQTKGLNLLSFVPDVRRPDGPEHAPSAEDDDGADHLAVRLHLQGAHPVPAQLQAHLNPTSSLTNEWAPGIVSAACIEAEPLPPRVLTEVKDLN